MRQRGSVASRTTCTVVVAGLASRKYSAHTLLSASWSVRSVTKRSACPAVLCALRTMLAKSPNDASFPESPGQSASCTPARLLLVFPVHSDLAGRGDRRDL